MFWLFSTVSISAFSDWLWTTICGPDCVLKSAATAFGVPGAEPGCQNNSFFATFAAAEPRGAPADVFCRGEYSQPAIFFSSQIQFFVECRIEYFALSPVAATECVFCCRYHITSIGFICLNQSIQAVLQFHHSVQKSKAFVAHIECGFMTYSDFLGSFIQWSGDNVSSYYRYP